MPECGHCRTQVTVEAIECPGCARSFLTSKRTFHILVRTKSGQNKQGYLPAKDEAELKRKLDKHGWLLLEILNAPRQTAPESNVRPSQERSPTVVEPHTYWIPPVMMCVAVLIIISLAGFNESESRGARQASSQLAMDLVSGSMLTVFLYCILSSIRRQIMETSIWLVIAVMIGFLCISILPSILVPGATTVMASVLLTLMVIIVIMDLVISVFTKLAQAASETWGKAKDAASTPQGRKLITSALFGFAAAIVIKSLLNDDAEVGEIPVAENGDIYGVDNDGDGIDETVHVDGYMREGHYVREHFRAPRDSNP